MKFKRVAWLVYLLALTYFSGEILVRRWFWGQVPTQVSASIVYVTLLVNAFVLWRGRRIFFKT